MLNTAWLIVHLIAGAISAPDAATAGNAASVSCTYQACMAKCSRLNGSICNSYCDARISQRLASGVCPNQSGLAVRAVLSK
jgi:hypothetical protein